MSKVKTALIQEFIKDKPALYFLATEESEPQSMKRFALSLSQFANQEFIAKANFDDWIELFKLFAAVPGKNTKVLVLDELPFLPATEYGPFAINDWRLRNGYFFRFV